MLLHIRCSHVNEHMNALAKWLQGNTSCYLLCFETGKRTEKRHFHALVDTLKSNTASTLRQQIHKHFCIKTKDEKFKVIKSSNIFVGQEHLTIRELKKDKNNNLCYIAKGVALGDFEYYGGIHTFEEATAYNKQYWETNEEIVKAQKIGGAGTTFMEKAKAVLKEKHPDEINDIIAYHRIKNENRWKHSSERQELPEYQLMLAHDEMFATFTEMLGNAVKKIDKQVAGMYSGIINSIITKELSRAELKTYSQTLFKKLFIDYDNLALK